MIASMEVILFNSSSLAALRRSSYFLKLTPDYLHHNFSFPLPTPKSLPVSLSLFSRRNCCIAPQSSYHYCSLNSTLLGILIPLTTSSHFELPISTPCCNESSSQFFQGYRGYNGGHRGLLTDSGPSVTVVLLGWLGAKQKHLKRYADFYTSKGIDAFTFVIPVKYLIGFDLGRRLEDRISELSRELIFWLSDTTGKKEGGRNLIFHTFSNTGWLVYGAILNHFQERQDLIARIKGCVVDSGPDPELNPKVWASGFSAALLKKRASINTREGIQAEKEHSSPILHDKESPLTETLLFSLLEKIFFVLLKLPTVNGRLTKIISILSKNQPRCPQLYLYSSADKVIGWESIEAFMAEQRSSGMEVWSYNFESSPHVDHYRTFPSLYASELCKFLRHCFSTALLPDFV